MKFKNLPVGARFTTPGAGSVTWWKKSPPVPHYGRTLNAISNGKEAYFVSIADDVEVILLEDDPATIKIPEANPVSVIASLERALLSLNTQGMPPSDRIKDGVHFIRQALAELGRNC